MPLPAWITQHPTKANVFTIDPDIAYTAVLDKLDQIGVKDGPTDKYWLEVAFQITKVVAQGLIEGAGLDPRPAASLILAIDSSGGRKGRWAMSNVPKGRGTIAATKGKEARAIHGNHTAVLRAALIAAQ